MKKNKESRLWVTVLALVAGALAIIALVGLMLWYAGESGADSPTTPSPNPWGIARDSPIRDKR